MYLYTKDGLGDCPKKWTEVGSGRRQIGAQHEVCPLLRDQAGGFIDWQNYLTRKANASNPLSKFKQFLNEDCYRAYLESCKVSAEDERKNLRPLAPGRKSALQRRLESAWDRLNPGPRLTPPRLNGLGGISAGIGQPGSLGQSAAPIFNIECPTPGVRLPVLRQAIREAIKLANNAATKVEKATMTAPNMRDADAKETARLFTSFFGHDPTFPVQWAGNEASGVSVAKRFRAVASELGGGRRIVFRCLDSRPGCADADLTCCTPTANAWVNQARVPNVVHLCAQFWNPPAGLRGLPHPYYRAGVIVHEMLHLLFQDFFRHGGPPGRPNTHCYEAFALRVAGFGADPFDVRRCANLGGWGGFGQPLPLPPTTPAPPRGFDPFKAAREAAEKIAPIRPETLEERLQRILKAPAPTPPGGRSFKEWFDRKMAERRVPKWLRDSIWKSFFDKN